MFQHLKQFALAVVYHFNHVGTLCKTFCASVNVPEFENEVLNACLNIPAPGCVKPPLSAGAKCMISNFATRTVHEPAASITANMDAQLGDKRSGTRGSHGSRADPAAPPV